MLDLGVTTGENPGLLGDITKEKPERTLSIVRNISLIGMPGSGKSTVGVLLAKALGYDFLDTDLVIQKREGQLLQPLVDTLGVEGFLDVEEAAILSVDCAGFVISPGGSVVLRETMVRHLKSLGPLVYLHVPLEELQARIHNLPTRGIAMEPNEDLSSVMAKRAPLYKEYADLVVTVTPGQTAEDMVMEILKKV